MKTRGYSKIVFLFVYLRMQEPEFFSTNDTYLAATLVTLGHFVVDVTRDGKNSSFKFEHSPALERDLEEYHRDGLLLQPQKLWSSFKYVKTLIYHGQ